MTTPTPSESNMTAVEQMAEQIVGNWHIADQDPYKQRMVNDIRIALTQAHATGYAEGRREERKMLGKYIRHFEECGVYGVRGLYLPGKSDHEKLCNCGLNALREAPHE